MYENCEKLPSNRNKQTGHATFTFTSDTSRIEEVDKSENSSPAQEDAESS
jgi:hypothetical protein